MAENFFGHQPFSKMATKQNNQKELAP